MQFVALSDANATDFVGRLSMPLLRDPSAGRQAWQAMEPGAFKHDTFVYDAAGKRVLYWDAGGGLDASGWRSAVGAAVRQLPP